MIHNQRDSTYCTLFAAGILFAALVFVIPARAQQDQNNLPGYPVTSDQQGTGNPVSPNSGQQPNPESAGPAPQVAAPPAMPANQPVPSELTLPTGTVIRIRTNEWLSTSRNLPGDS